MIGNLFTIRHSDNTCLTNSTLVRGCQIARKSIASVAIEASSSFMVTYHQCGVVSGNHRLPVDRKEAPSFANVLVRKPFASLRVKASESKATDVEVAGAALVPSNVTYTSARDETAFACTLHW